MPCVHASRQADRQDRDGVINRDSDQFIKTPDEWRPIPGQPRAVARLNHAAFASSSRPISPASAAACLTWRC